MFPVIRSIAKHLDIYSSPAVIQKIPPQKLLSSITRKIDEIIIQRAQCLIPRQYLISSMLELEELLKTNSTPFETLSLEQTALATKQVTQTKQLLRSPVPYATLWGIGQARCVEGALIFSKKLRQNLNDYAFEELLKAMPEEQRKEVTTCSLLDTLDLTEKSFETVLKYLPNISEESLCETGQTALDMWNAFKPIPKEERQDVFLHAEKLFNRRTFGEDKILIIEAIAKIAKEDRTVVTDYVVEISKELISSALEIESLLHAIAILPEKNRANIMDKVIMHFKLGLFRECPIAAIESAATAQENNQTKYSSPLKEKPLSMIHPLPIETPPIS